MAQLQAVVSKFLGDYNTQTPKKLKLIDAYLLYILLTGIFQFVYCCLVGTFPFNSFLSGFISTISCFVLGGKHPIPEIMDHLLTTESLSSLPPIAVESTKQVAVLRTDSGARIRWLHLRPHRPPLGGDELYRIDRRCPLFIISVICNE